MDRRKALKSIVGALGVGVFSVPSLAKEEDVEDYGAIKPSRRQRIAANKRPRPGFYDRFAPFKGISTLSKNVFLWKNLEREIGEIEPHYQGSAPDGTPGEGDCVGHAAAMGCDVLSASDIHFLNEREKFLAKSNVEMIYAGSRVEIGGDQISGGGSRGIWAAKYLKQYGVLHRIQYKDEQNSIDLSGYHPGRSRQYRRSGVPDWLEPIARQHPVQEYTNVRTGKEALDAICAGQPVIMCSSYAFHDLRDDEGFCQPYLGGTYKRGWRQFSFRKQWWHAMVMTGALLEGGRVGGLIQNSHGAWNSGPRPYGIPVGSFFVDLKYIDLMVKDWGDCWALSSYKGHEAGYHKHRLY